MNNWRLLLLAVVVVVQPIGSFTESNLIDGRECCQRRSTEDERLYGYRKTEDRRLSLVDEIREARRYEYNRDPVLIRSERLSSDRNERRISPELKSRATVANRFSRHQDRYRATPELRQTRDIRENERNARESRNRATLDATRTIKLSRDVVRDTNLVSDRGSKTVVSRLPIQASRSVEDRRISPNREESETIFEREDIAHIGSRRERQSASRSERIQLDDNRERRIIGTRKDGNKLRLSRPSITRVNEIRVREQRSVEKSEGDSRRYRDVEFRQQRETELRVSAVRRNSETVSANTMRGSGADVPNSVDFRNAERISERRQRDGKVDTLQRFVKHQLDSQQSRSRTLEMARQDERMDNRKQLSMDRHSMLRENRGALSRASGRNSLIRGNLLRDSTERQETRRIVRPSRTDMNFRNQLDSRIRNDFRNTEKSYFRSQGNERGIKPSEMTIHNARDSTSTELREVLSVSSGPSQASRIREETRNNENVDSRRQIRDQNRVNERTIVQREDRNANRRLETRRSLSFESIRLERAVRNRDDVRQNRDQERSVQRTVARETHNVATPQRLDTRRTISRETERRDSQRKERGDESSERVFVERRQENSEKTRDSRNVRDEAKNRKIRLDERMNLRLQRDVSGRRVLTERNAIKDSRNARAAVTRTEVGNDERMDLRRLRDVTRRTNQRVLAESRQENRDAIRDSRNARAMTRREVRMDKRMDSRRDVASRTNERVVERRQENRETPRYLRTVRDKTRNLENRMDSRRDASKESRTFLIRESRVGTERLIQKNDGTLSRNERATRNIEREVRFVDRNEKRDNVLNQKSKSDDQSNDLLSIEYKVRRVSNVRDKQDDFRFRNEDSLAFRDTMVQEKSDESVFSWRMVFYTLQGIYLLGLLVQMLTDSANKTKKSNNWWASSKNLVKVD